MAHLTIDQREELEAIRLTTQSLGKPTYLNACLHRDPVERSLIRRGLITWRKAEPESGWSRSFRAVELTDKGRAALADTGET